MNHYLLMGGGLDSTSLYLHLLSMKLPVDLIHVDYSQKAYKSELVTAFSYAKEYNRKLHKLCVDLSFSKARIIINSPIGESQNDNKLELRNFIFISMAASFIASNNMNPANLYLGFHEEPEDAPFPDARTKYLSTLEYAIQLAGVSGVYLKTPFSKYSRKKVAKIGYDLDKDIFTKTHTCYEGIECNKCIHCKEKEKIMRELGIN